jgi:CRP-like cAMP-binding protein
MKDILPHSYNLYNSADVKADDSLNVALKKCRLFQGLSDVELRSLHPACLRLRLKAGEVLFHAGSPGGSLYIVDSGELAIEISNLRPDGSNDVVHIGSRGVGEVVGEFSLFDDKPRSSKVRAGVPTVLIQIEGKTFRHILSRSNELSLGLIKTLIEKLVESQSQTVSRQNEKLSVRLARTLLGLSDEKSEGPFKIRNAPTQKQLALRLGCSREAVNRAVAQYGEGVVVFSRGLIEIKDPRALKRLAEQRRGG